MKISAEMIKCPYCGLKVANVEINRKGKVMPKHTETCIDRAVLDEKAAVKAGWLIVGVDKNDKKRIREKENRLGAHVRRIRD